VIELTNAVLGYPYESGLYFMFSRTNPSGPSPTRGHPYYEALFGSNPLEQQFKAANLASLFDTVLLAGADEYLPDNHLYSTGESYYHPDLRVRVPEGAWPRFEEAEAFAKKLSTESLLAELVQRGYFPSDPYQLQEVVARTIMQMRLASSHHAVLVLGDGGAALANRILALAQTECLTGIDSSSASACLLHFPDSVLPLVGLDWRCEDIDSFAAIRQSKEISCYGRAFRDKVATISDPQALRDALVDLMRDAMDHQSIAARTKGAFETTGSAANIAGFIPVVGTVASLIGVGADAAARAAGRYERQSHWYLMGPKLREVALKAMLNRTR
jgi:hypothetical protein